MSYIGKLKKGSLVTSTGTNNVELVAATDAQVLTLDSGDPNGVKWATPTTGTVTNVMGTANQVGVVGGTTTPVISLIGPYTPSTYTAHGVLIGEGTSSIVALGAGTAGQILQSGGASADPAYSTSTYPTTNAINTLLYASAANTMAALATANGGVLTTSSTGVPSIDTTNFRVSSTGVQMKGNNTSTTPPAGFIGQQVRSAIASGSAVALVNSTGKTVTSISLTAGIWDVVGLINFIPGATTTVSQHTASLSATDNTIGTQGDNMATWNYLVSITGIGATITVPSYRVETASTITYYLVASSNFSVSTMSAYGRISATRVG